MIGFALFGCGCIGRIYARNIHVAVMDWATREVLSWRVSNTIA